MINDPSELPLIFKDCDTMYYDVGSNVGVQVRKLFEPQKYPKAKIKPFFELPIISGIPPALLATMTLPYDIASYTVLGELSKIEGTIQISDFKYLSFNSFAEIKSFTSKNDKPFMSLLGK